MSSSNSPPSRGSSSRVHEETCIGPSPAASPQRAESRWHRVSPARRPGWIGECTRAPSGTRKKPICSHFPDGASRDRTGDLLLAKRAPAAAVCRRLQASSRDLRQAGGPLSPSTAICRFHGASRPRSSARLGPSSATAKLAARVCSRGQRMQETPEGPHFGHASWPQPTGRRSLSWRWPGRSGLVYSPGWMRARESCSASPCPSPASSANWFEAARHTERRHERLITERRHCAPTSRGPDG